MKGNQITATRATLTDEWKAQEKLRDWMHVPDMANYVNKMVSGKDLGNGGHWSIYANEKYVRPLAEKRHGGFTNPRLSMVSLACGAGHIEASLIKEFHWPITEFVGLEYDAQLREAAARAFSTIPGVSATFDFYDFNAPRIADRQFDIVFTCHSIHHATDLENMMRFANSLLKDDGLFIGIDFFGPTQFQAEYEIRPILSELYAMLPPDLQRDLRNPRAAPSPTFEFKTIAEVKNADPSESVRSSDLRTLLFSTFPVIERKPMGGTILRWLLENRAGNFNPNNDAHRSIAHLLAWIERTMIEDRRIKSDDLFFVLGKSASL